MESDFCVIIKNITHMLATNIITVDDCPHTRSTCKACKDPIVPTEPRIRTSELRYCHLKCYIPKYPVTLLPSDITNHLQRPQNQFAFEDWISRWNSQFRPLDVATIHTEKCPKTREFSRAHIEVFKYLTSSEVVLAVELTCRRWKQLAWSEELWRDFVSREYPNAVLQDSLPARHNYLRLLFQACLACRKLPNYNEIRVVCPNTKRPICAGCYQKPGSSVFLVSQYATLMGISQEYMRDSGVSVYAYNHQHWVFSHQADTAINTFRVRRRSEMLKMLQEVDNNFAVKDVQKIKSLNLGRAKYIGVVLKHRFEGEEDLIDLLQYVYAASEGRGLTMEKLIKRNRRRRLRTVRAEK